MLKRLPLIFAATSCVLLSGCLMLQSGAVAPEMETVEVLKWEADSPLGQDCSKQSWINDVTKHRSAGPYRIDLRIGIDADRLSKSKSDFQILFFEWARVQISPDGFLKISRCPERRSDGDGVDGPPSHVTSERSIAPADLRNPLDISVQWTGQFYEVYVNKVKWASMKSEGTRIWEKLEVGRFPGWVESVRFTAF